MSAALSITWSGEKAGSWTHVEGLSPKSGS